MKAIVASLVIIAACFAARHSMSGMEQLRTLSASETVVEVTTGIEFIARVDTGAASSSVHCDTMEIENPASEPSDNVGKPIRFQVENKQGQSEWFESVIADHVKVKTSERTVGRYKVRLVLRCQNIEKSVLVTLNDRSRMQYPLLLGRNFLRDDFVVKVESDHTR